MDLLAALRFEMPGYLALLAVIPLLLVLALRSLAGLGPIRRALAIAIRCIVVLLIVVALAGALRTQRIDDLTVLFLVDRSKSIPPDLQRAELDYITRASKDKPHTDDRVGVIAFDGVADVQQLPMRAGELDQISAPVESDETNIAAALRMAAAVLPSDTKGRIVLMSDGNENVGDALQEAERFRAAGIPVDVLPIQYEHTN